MWNRLPFRSDVSYDARVLEMGLGSGDELDKCRRAVVGKDTDREYQHFLRLVLAKIKIDVSHKQKRKNVYMDEDEVTESDDSIDALYDVQKSKGKGVRKNDDEVAESDDSIDALYDVQKSKGKGIRKNVYIDEVAESDDSIDALYDVQKSKGKGIRKNVYIDEVAESDDSIDARCDVQREKGKGKRTRFDNESDKSRRFVMGKDTDSDYKLLFESNVSHKRKKGNDRPKASKKVLNASTKHNPRLFEYQQSDIESCSEDDEVVYEMSDTLTSPIFDKKQLPKVRPSVFRRSVCSSGNITSLLPIEFQPYIVECKNVKGDGHCGFRAVAALMGFGENAWDRVRQDLMDELNHHTRLYKDVFGENDRVEEILETLDCFADFAPFENWFMLPYMGHLVASTYNCAFITLSRQMSITYLPLRSAVARRPSPRSISMGMVNQNHFIQVLLGAGHPIPPIADAWFDHHRKIAGGWEEAYYTGQI